MKKLLILTSSVSLLSAPAFAAPEDMQEKMQKMQDHYFMEMDTNKDNRVSKSEHDALMNRMFTEADTNKDGSISRDEQAASFERNMDKMHEAKAGGHGGNHAH